MTAGATSRRSRGGGACRPDAGQARLRPLFAVACVLAAFALAPSAPAARAESAAGTLQGRAQLEAVRLFSAGGEHVVEAEVMRSPQERAQGLMYRRFLPSDRGMLFLFAPPQVVNMWMKNTYIPLDMIFIGPDGRVVSIARDTEPLSERIVSSGAAAAAVLEVNSGVADKIGLRVGDRVVYPPGGK